ncbi:hypothetical protein, partial [Escherichia coli]
PEHQCMRVKDVTGPEKIEAGVKMSAEERESTSAERH